MGVSASPWQNEEEWSQITLFFQRSIASVPNRDALDSLVQTIASRIVDLEGELDRLCAANCPACTDTCCRRATVWYDFRDLLFLYCLSEKLPARQIIKDEKRGCMNLGSTGCVLPRLERPFVCTWYLCPAQVSTGRCKDERFFSLTESIGAVQKLRKELERQFLAAVV